MKYNKPALTLDEQIKLLQSRGLIVVDKAYALSLLNQISYYRLSAYCIPFQGEKDKFKDEVTLEDVYYLYQFDKKLRYFVSSYLENIEIAIRCHMTYELSHKYGAFGYLEPSNYAVNFPHAKWMEDVNKEIARSRESFIDHFRKKYHLTANFPLWMASETFSFNVLSRMFSGLKNQDKKIISSKLNVHHKVFGSWIHSLCYVRNLCAHHGRLWNKELAIEPKIPEYQPIWHTPESFSNKRVFATLTIMYFLLKELKLSSDFKKGLVVLLKEFPKVDIARMGFIKDWGKHSIWI